MTNTHNHYPRGERPSPTMEQYVEAIAQLLTQAKVCSVSDIAAEANVSRPAASRAVRDLAERALVEHRAYGYVDLTPEGRALAGKLDARHEALQTFLAKVLGFEDTVADEEACRLEHLINDETIERLALLTQFLSNHPRTEEDWRRELTCALECGALSQSNGAD
ncbi:MAG: metal-dependent transcriptional regulator [Candidatus Hydrogenedentota bacterium]